ncbi:hypothetical protein AB0A70_23660 [Streptomyces morookaense]|uniref:hypothetical protein n=1 Tax=Streptomyces morookaense TaxID=1970 RepID=UPI0033CDFAB3
MTTPLTGRTGMADNDGKVDTVESSVGAGGGWWTAAQSNDSGTEAYSVWAGHADCTGAVDLGKDKTAAATLFPFDLTVSQDAVTVTSQPQGPPAGRPCGSTARPASPTW